MLGKAGAASVIFTKRSDGTINSIYAAYFSTDQMFLRNMNVTSIFYDLKIAEKTKFTFFSFVKMFLRNNWLVAKM